MNDSLEYAKMIEIPCSSTEYIYKHKKHLFKKKDVLNKINNNLNEKTGEKKKRYFFSLKKKNAEKQEAPENSQQCEVENNSCPSSCEEKCTSLALPDAKIRKKEKIKSGLIKAQVAASVALAVAIVLTNIFWENSGMNTLFKSVFGAKEQQEQVDNRTPEDFTLTLPAESDSVSIDKGVITIKGEYSLYPVCKGVVKSVEKSSDGSYTVTICHSDNFSSIMEGVDMVYFEKGDYVFQNVPLGWSAEKALVYLYSQDKLVTDYAAVENSLVFDK